MPFPKTITTILLLFTISFLCGQQTAISIQEARSINPDGTLVRQGETVELSGIAIGPNFRPSGLTFVLYDTIDNIGITVFAFNNDSGYIVEDGDALTITGELDQFNGLAEIIPSAIVIESQGNGIPEPETVTVLNETTESNLIKFENASLVDPDAWEASGSFNVAISNGSDTIEMRIDSDIGLGGLEAPVGPFDVTGIGGQFDNSSPFTSGYQILPRSMDDIDPYITAAKEYDAITIAQARETEQDGTLRRAGDCISLTAVVHGINLRPSGLQFTIIDPSNTGIGVFSSSETFGYTVKEGDELMIMGVLSQFSGLAQINPDSLIFLSSGNALVSPDLVTGFGENTESALIQVNAQAYVDESEWLGDGSSFNVRVITLDNDTLTVRIDSDTELANMTPPPMPASITGIGGQFDPSAPFDSGYQILPRYMSDFESILSTVYLYDEDIRLYPNPATDRIYVDADNDIESLEIFDLTGKLLVRGKGPVLNFEAMPVGNYFVKINFGDKFGIRPLSITR